MDSPTPIPNIPPSSDNGQKEQAPEEKHQEEKAPASEPMKAEPERVKEIHHHHHYEKKGPSLFRLLLGLLVILVGLAWLSSSLGWGWGISVDVWRFWPVIIIFFGLSLLSRGSAVLRTISAIIVLFVFFLITALLFWPANRSDKEFSQTIDVPIDATAQQTDVRLKLGAVDFTLLGETDNALSGVYTSDFVDLQQTASLHDGRHDVTLSMDAGSQWWQFPFGGARKTTLLLRAGRTLPLDLRLDGGAMNADMDFRAIPLKNLDINTGATKLTLTLGDLLEQSDITIDAGASSIDISLPKSVGVALKIDSGLTGKDLPDFRKIDEEHYESENYAAAAKKMDINLNLGASSVSTTWR